MYLKIQLQSFLIRKYFNLFLILSSLTFLLLANSAYARVTIEKNVTFNTTGTNATYFVGQNFTVDEITITSNFMDISNSSGHFIMSAMPSSGSVNIMILEFDKAHKKFNLTNNTPSITANMTLGNLTPNTIMQVRKNSIFWNAFTSNSSGFINFAYDGGFSTSTITLEILSAYSYGQSCSLNGECSNGLCVHNICRSSSTYCGDNYCDSSETCSNCLTDCACSSGYYCSDGACIIYGGSAPVSISTIGGKSTVKIASITPYRPIIIDTAKTNTHITEISISSTALVANVKIDIQRLEKVTGLSALDSVYSYINITKENILDENIIEARIKFKVEKIWITANNIDENTVVLERYAGNSWNKLNTTRMNEDVNYTYYEAVIKGFSIFAITGEKKVIPPVEEKKCPACRQPTAWSDCVNNKQTRTNYKCSAETSYTCQSYVEERECAIEKQLAWIWIAGGTAVLAMGIVYWQVARKKNLVKSKKT